MKRWILVPTEFKRKLQVLEQNQERKMLPILTGRQIVYQMFAFFKINYTQGRVMTLSDLLNTELYNGNLRVINKTWDKIRIEHALGLAWQKWTMQDSSSAPR